MNCVKGDIAIVVGASVDAGKIVRCLEFVGAQTPFADPDCADCWIVDRELMWTEISTQRDFAFPYASDALLRPIRDTDAPDEMLKIVGRPETVTA